MGACTASTPRRPKRRPIRTGRSRWSCRSRPADRPTAWRASSRSGSARCSARPSWSRTAAAAQAAASARKFVATADPDGYTILMTPGGSLTTGPAVHNNIGYDPVKVFTPVGQLIETPLIIAVHPEPAGEDDGRARGLRQGQSGQDQLGLAGLRHRAASARSSCSSSKPASTSSHVPYRGTAPMLDRNRRRAKCRSSPIRAPPSCRTSNPASCAPIADRRRRRARRNCPTCRPSSRRATRSCNRHSGSAWWRRPERRRAIIDKLNAAFRESLAAPETRARLDALGAEIKIGTPEDFGKMLAKELRASGPRSSRRRTSRWNELRRLPNRRELRPAA